MSVAIKQICRKVDFHFPIMASLSGGTNLPPKSQPFILYFLFKGFNQDKLHSMQKKKKKKLIHNWALGPDQLILYFQSPSDQKPKCQRRGCVMKSFNAGTKYLLLTFSTIYSWLARQQEISAPKCAKCTVLLVQCAAKCSVPLSADQITQIRRHHMSHYLGHSSS